jgi:hypothetical protein
MGDQDRRVNVVHPTNNSLMYVSEQKLRSALEQETEVTQLGLLEWRSKSGIMHFRKNEIIILDLASTVLEANHSSNVYKEYHSKFQVRTWTEISSGVYYLAKNQEALTPHFSLRA